MKILKHTVNLVCFIFIFTILCFSCKEDKTSMILNLKGQEPSLTILFTNDMHSYAEEKRVGYQMVSPIDSAHLVGGFSRLATVIEQERQKCDANGSTLLLVDAGDMAMGTTLQTLFTQEAFELSYLSKMCYDVITLGNHDFDYGMEACAKMLMSAKSKNTTVPQIVLSNIIPSAKSSISLVFEEYGVTKSTIIQKNGLRIGIIGSMGEDAYSVISKKESITFVEPMQAVKHEVEKLRGEGVDYVILISHGGTNGSGNYKKSEDWRLAKKVSGIDVIISGHDHDFLYEPLYVNGTYIGSSGAYCNYLGKMVLSGRKMIEYELIPLDLNISPNLDIKEYIDSIKQLTDNYLINKFNLSQFDTLTILEREYYDTLNSKGYMELGLLIAQSYSEAVLKYANIDGVIGIVPMGTIRGHLAKGVVTVEDVFRVLSLGVSNSIKSQIEAPGSPLILAWLTGKEIEDVCELVASVSPMMRNTTLFFSNLEFSKNKYRPIFFKASAIKINGKPLDKNMLYPVVTGTYTAELIGLLEGTSYGILSATPKDSLGIPIKDFNDAVLHESLTEWRALAEKLKFRNNKL